MSIGTGIFLSALMLSVVILFAVTKDRWNWKRILKWGLLLPISITVLLSIGLYSYNWLADRPTPQTDFESIPLTATPADVRFLKGEPLRRYTSDRWAYNVNYEPESSDPARYMIKFKDNQIHYILYSPGDSRYGRYLLGFNKGSSYQDVQARLGTPSHTSQSPDELGRIICYDKLNVFFAFREGHVYEFGIYQPKFGPIKFASKFQREDD